MNSAWSATPVGGDSPRVRTANRNLPCEPDGSLPECWLLIERPDDAAEPTDCWLGALPETLVTAAHLFITTQRLTADPKRQGQPELV